jgi:hypothetical protein
VKSDALAFQSLALATCRIASAGYDQLPLGIDNPMPRYVRVLGQYPQCATHTAGGPRQACVSGHVAIGRNTARRDHYNYLPDA